MATTSAPRSGYATDARTPSLPLAPPRTHIPGHQRRQSRFTEMENDNRPTPPPPMDEYTPAHSIATNTERETDTDSESEDEGSPAGRRRSRSSWGIALRVLNGCVHGVACVLLLYIMVGFLKEMGGTWYKIMSPQAVTLTVLLGLDIVLDISALAQIHKKWPGWVVLLRLTCGIGYLIVFMVYIGLGHVFPYMYTYWGIEASYAGPVVYLFLWLIGVWNLLHTALHRHALANVIRIYAAAFRSGPSQAARSSRRPSRRRNVDIGSQWRRWRGTRASAGSDQAEVDTERQRRRRPSRERGDANDISLTERNGEENKAGSLSTTVSRPQTEETVTDTGQQQDIYTTRTTGVR